MPQTNKTEWKMKKKDIKKEEEFVEEKPLKVMHNLIILDESGSMDSIKAQALSGANETIMTIRKAQEDMPEMLQKLTFVTFDSLYDGTDVRTIFDDLPIEEVRNLHERDYCPCGGTPLYDAMGVSLSKLQRQVQPGEHALVTIITDGMENASHEYSGKAIKSIVSLLREKGWVFAYLGANQDAVEVASDMNINNAKSYAATPEGYATMVCEESRHRMSFFKRCYEGLMNAGENFFDEEDESK